MQGEKVFPDRPHWGLLLCLALASWPPAALALDAAGELDVMGLPYLQMLASGCICLWGSLGRTGQRAKLAKQEQIEFRWWHEVLADAKRSVVIGPLVYIAGTMQGWDVWQLGFALIFGGYLGPTALDLWAAKFRGGA